MPSPYYLAMLLVLVAAIVAELAHGPAIPGVATALILGSSFVSIAGVIFIQYLISTPVGGVECYCMQGRYFIPIVIAAAIGLPRLGNSLRAYERFTAIVVLAQLLTIVVLPQVILARYYGR
jgi:uncharacterized membrane protein